MGDLSDPQEILFRIFSHLTALVQIQHGDEEKYI